MGLVTNTFSTDILNVYIICILYVYNAIRASHPFQDSLAIIINYYDNDYYYYYYYDHYASKRQLSKSACRYNIHTDIAIL